LEAQVVDFADGIAYNAHDLDDGITSNLLDLDQLRQVELWRKNEKFLDKKYSNLDFTLKKYQVVRGIIDMLVTDFRKTTLKNAKKYQVNSADDVRRAPVLLAGFSKAVHEKNKELKNFLFKNMYRHSKVRSMETKAKRYLTGIFQAYLKTPKLIPKKVLLNDRFGSVERRMCDYISGMTDRYAISEFEKVYTPDEKD
jgi:dGTPase